MKDMNKIILRGRIVHLYNTGKNSYVVTIDDGQNNFIKVFICDRVNTSIIKNYKVNDCLEIEGNLQSAIREDVKRPPTIFCEKINEYPRYDMRTKNDFVIQGTVKKVCVINNDCWRITVSTFVNEHYSVIPIIVYNPDVRLYNQEPGEKICIYGEVQTVKKYGENRKPVYYQNFVAK